MADCETVVKKTDISLRQTLFSDPRGVQSVHLRELRLNRTHISCRILIQKSLTASSSKSKAKHIHIEFPHHYS